MKRANWTFTFLQLLLLAIALDARQCRTAAKTTTTPAAVSQSNPTNDDSTASPTQPTTNGALTETDTTKDITDESGDASPANPTTNAPPTETDTTKDITDESGVASTTRNAAPTGTDTTKDATDGSGNASPAKPTTNAPATDESSNVSSPKTTTNAPSTETDTTNDATDENGNVSPAKPTSNSPIKSSTTKSTEADEILTSSTISNLKPNTDATAACKENPGKMYLPDPNDCHQFIQCDESRVGYIMSCPENQYWDRKNLTCSPKCKPLSVNQCICISEGK